MDWKDFWYVALIQLITAVVAKWFIFKGDETEPSLYIIAGMLAVTYKTIKKLGPEASEQPGMFVFSIVLNTGLSTSMLLVPLVLLEILLGLIGVTDGQIISQIL